jgi:hypothetical protein
LIKYLKTNKQQTISVSIGVVEILDDEILQILYTDFPFPVSIHDLHIRRDIGGSGLKTFIHGPVAVN